MPSGRHPARPSGQPDCDCCRVAGGHCAVAAGAGRFGPGSRVGRSEFGVWGWIVPACHAAPEGASPAGALRRSGPGCAWRNPAQPPGAQAHAHQQGRTTAHCCVRPVSGPARLAHVGRLAPARLRHACARCPRSARPHCQRDRPGPAPAVSRSRSIQAVAAVVWPAFGSCRLSALPRQAADIAGSHARPLFYSGSGKLSSK